MEEIKNRLKEVSKEINENIVAVKGTLELLEASDLEDEMQNLLLKAIDRIETIQKLSNEIFYVIQQILEKINKKSQ